MALICAFYGIETACDKHGWILGYSVHPGNQHDSTTFPELYEKIKGIGIETMIADAGYKTPSIAKLLIDDGIRPLFPYKRPMTKEGYFKKYEYVYDEKYLLVVPGKTDPQVRDNGAFADSSFLIGY